jgi:hypothetical protein
MVAIDTSTSTSSVLRDLSMHLSNLSGFDFKKAPNKNMQLLFYVIGTALLVACEASKFRCRSYSTVEDLFYNKSSTTLAQLGGRNDGVGALVQHSLYLTAYVRYRGWSVGEILRQLSCPSDHGINKTIFLDFMFPNIYNIGNATKSDQPLRVVSVESTQDLELLGTVENTFYEIKASSFDLEAIAHHKGLTLDDYFNPQFLAVMRNLTICSIKRELFQRSLYYKHGAKKLRVVAHIRRGDVHADAESRWTPDVYFVGVLKAIRDLYPHAELHVFSSKIDPLHNDTVWKPYWDSGIHVHVTDEYLPTNTEQTITALAHLMSADVFMMSKSSFSALPALYNPNCVLYTPFYHGHMKKWIVLPSDFNLETTKEILKTQLVACIEALRHPHLGRHITTL